MNEKENVHQEPEHQSAPKGDAKENCPQLITPATFGLIKPATFGLISPATFHCVSAQHTPIPPTEPQSVLPSPVPQQFTQPPEQHLPTAGMQPTGYQHQPVRGMRMIQEEMARAGAPGVSAMGIPTQMLAAREPLPAQTGDVVDTRSPRKTPYAVVQELIRDNGIIVSNNAVYYFKGPVYTLLGKEDIKRLIVGRCRTDIETNGGAAFIENIYKILLSEPRICRDDLIPSQDEVVFLDGVLNLRTNEFTGISPRCFATSYLNASYQRGQMMPCPVFDRFVAGIAGGDSSLECRIWEVLGYCLTQDQRGKCFVVLQGPPDSGKSLFGNFLRECFNKEAVSSLNLHSFGSTFALADIIGKRLCIDLDLPAGSVNSRAASILKKMTGGDMLSANIKYMPSVNFINTAKFFFASNHAVIPHVRDEAFLKRLIVVPFFFSVPEDMQDHSLGEKLAVERDGVITKALHYYIALRDGNYRFTGHFPANMAVMDYDDSGDCLIKFLREECEEAPHGWVSTQELYARFCQRFGARWAMNVFSGRINEVLPFIFPGAEKIRSRISGSGNPIGGFSGLALKDPRI